MSKLDVKIGQSQTTMDIKKITDHRRTSKNLLEVTEEMGISPFEFLLHVINNDWKAIGYDSPSITMSGKDGGTYEIDRISLSDRVACAREATQYLHAKKKSVEVKGSDDENAKPIKFEGSILDLIRIARG